MNEDKKQYILQWISKARQDMIAAEKLLDDNSLTLAGIIGFHCQQSVEKFLKAFLVFKDFDFLRTHNLEELRDKCGEYDADFLKMDYFDLTDYAVDYRYPNDEFNPEMNEVENYYNLVIATKELVLNKIRLN